MIDVVVLNYNDSDKCLEYVDCIKNHQVIDHILIVDNCSRDESFEKLKKIENGKIIVRKTEKNGGYGYGNNYGIVYLSKSFNSHFVAITNPDVKYNEDALFKCVEFLKRNEQYTICAPRMKKTNGSYSFCAWNLRSWYEYVFQNLILLGRLVRENNLKEEMEGFFVCDCVAGSMLVVDVDNFKKIGMYDENIFLYCEETVLGFKNGRQRAAILKDAFFVHEHSVSINKSIKSTFLKSKIQWTSRMYVLREYYHLRGIKYAIAYAVMIISLIECGFISWLKTLKKV